MLCLMTQKVKWGTLSSDDSPLVQIFTRPACKMEVRIRDWLTAERQWKRRWKSRNRYSNSSPGQLTHLGNSKFPVYVVKLPHGNGTSVRPLRVISLIFNISECYHCNFQIEITNQWLFDNQTKHLKPLKCAQ